MKTCRLFDAFMTILLASAAIAPALAKTPPQAARLETLCAKLDQAREDDHVPGLAVAIVQDDTVILARGFGLRDIESGAPVEPTTHFAIGSTTKAFTTTLIGMLVDEGKLSWDDHVRDHVPYFKLKDETANEQVTLRDLLCHRVGLSRTPLLWAANTASTRRIISQLRHAEPIDQFRKSWHYNNVMYLVAGTAAANAAGAESWGALLTERLIDPLDMRTTHTSAERMETDPAAARGYLWDQDADRYVRLPLRHVDAVAPAGAIYANAEEMARWVRFQLADGELDGRRLIKAATLEETHTPQIALGGDKHYALGWMTETWRGRRIVQHGGNIDGFAAQVTLMPDEHVGFVLLANVGVTKLQATAAPLIWEAVLGLEPDESEATSDTTAGDPWTAEQMQPLVGQYHLPALNVDVEVLVRDERLAIDVPGQMVYMLKWPDPRGRWKFDFPAPIELEFDEPVNGVAPAATLYQRVELSLSREREGTPPGRLAKDLPAAGEPWTAAQMKPLLGKYRLGPGDESVWGIVIKGDELAVDMPGQTQWPLHWPDQDGRWKIKVDPKQSLEFDPDDKGRVMTARFQKNLVMPMSRVVADTELGVTVDDLFALRAAETLDALPQQTLRVIAEARFVNQGVRAHMTITADADRLLVDMDANPFGYSKTFLVGDRLWLDSNIESNKQIGPADVELARLGHPFIAYGDWRPAFTQMSVGGEDEVDGRKVYVVRCVTQHTPALRKYVDAETGLVLGEDSFIPNPVMGSIPISTEYSDFREVAGVQIPFRAVTKNEHTGEMVVQIKKIETDYQIPEGLFTPQE